MYIIGVDVDELIKEDKGEDVSRAYSLAAFSTMEYSGLQSSHNSKYSGMFFKEKEFTIPEKKKLYRIWKKELTNKNTNEVGKEMIKFWWCIEKFNLQSMLFNILLSY